LRRQSNASSGAQAHMSRPTADAEGSVRETTEVTWRRDHPAERARPQSPCAPARVLSRVRVATVQRCAAAKSAACSQSRCARRRCGPAPQRIPLLAAARWAHLAGRGSQRWRAVRWKLAFRTRTCRRGCAATVPCRLPVRGVMDTAPCVRVLTCVRSPFCRCSRPLRQLLPPVAAARRTCQRYGIADLLAH
jgi:hypothetical protein